MDHEIALFFRDQFRAARATVLRDSEAYEAVVLVLEQLGRLHLPQGIGMGNFRPAVCAVAADSALSHEIPTLWPDYHHTFETLYESVREARNLMVHEGALARHLSGHALECSLALEDALVKDMKTASEFMVRSPVTVSMWQPLSFVRQIMLTNSFSYLPVRLPAADGGVWHFVSDVSLARALRDTTERSRRLAMPLGEAVETGTIKLCAAQTVGAGATIESVVAEMDELPVLVVEKERGEVLGIVTAFDLL